MKNYYFLFLFFISSICLGQDLIITGVIDGPLRGGIPKAIELQAKNDIADLSLYGLGSANNGGGTDGQEFTFPSASLKAGQFIYVATEKTGFTKFFGFEPNYVSRGAAGINGDDAIELFYNDEVVDVFGDVNIDGTGQSWEYKDGWAYRKDGVNTNGGVFNADNWIFSGKDALDNQTTNETATNPFPLQSYGPDLIITGVIDGPLRGGIPKAIELYAKNDITNLSAYGLGAANNGGGTDGQEFVFPLDTLKAGQFIYVATEETGFTNFFGFAPTYVNGSAASINGDDAIELFYNDEVIDIFGDINTDGTGQPWEYKDGWAYRKNETGPDGTTFVVSNWTYSGKDALDGATSNTTAPKPFPIGTYGANGGIDPNPSTPISIADARKVAEGSIVTVKGVLTVSDQFAGSAYVQDTTGGIAIFDKAIHGAGKFEIGDKIQITGTRSAFRKQVQISGVTKVEKLGVSSIAPKTVSINELSNYAGQLVRVASPTFPRPGDLIFGNSNYTITAGDGSEGQVRIDLDVADLVGLGQPATCNEVIGVVGRFEDIYQLLPRQKSDLACATSYTPPTNPSDVVSKENTLDIVTWNIEWFGDEKNSPAAGNPNSDAIQKEKVKDILKQLDADVIAVQEIADEALFDSMIKELPDYDYILSDATSYPNDTEGVKQKIGFIYKQSTVSIKNTKALLKSIHPYYNGGDSSVIESFPNEDKTRFFASGRLPFLMTADVTINGVTKEYDFVSLHARANRNSDAQNRYNMRKYDVEVLKDSLDTYYADKNLVVLGDYNDDVDETVVADFVSDKTTSYDKWVKDTENYTIVSEELTNKGFRSFVFVTNMIDHIALSDEVDDYYLVESSRVHYEFYNNMYSRSTSDHFPVSARLEFIDPLKGKVVTTDVTCNGAKNGSATFSVEGGVAPYEYSLDGVSYAMSATFKDLTVGSYLGVIKDARGEVVNLDFTITEPVPIAVTTTEDKMVIKGYYEDTNCATLEVLSINGGKAPYTYAWSTGEVSQSINVCPDTDTTYTVTVTDALGCTTTKAIVVKVKDVSCDNGLLQKVQVCYKGRNLCLPIYTANYFLQKGGVLGSCKDEVKDKIVITQLRTYPNPLVDVLNIELTSCEDTTVDVTIYNWYGGKVMTCQEGIKTGKSTLTYNLSQQQSGIYYLKVSINGSIQKTKALFKH